MERLLHSPGRTRDEYRNQAARPSSQLISRTGFTFVSTTPLRGNELATEFGAKPGDSLDYSNKFTGRKINEKELLQGLNDRFAGFIEKVHHLENQNRALEREIETIRLKAKSSACLSKEYESEMNNLRQQVHEMSLQKHQTEINRQNLVDEFNILKEKYDREMHGRADAEGSISVLKKCINDAYLAKQEMDRKAKALEDEISFLKKNHESEVAEMMAQMQEGQVMAEMCDYSRSDITAALRVIRMQLEGHTTTDTRHEERFRAQLAKLTKAAEVNREALMATKAEINEHRRHLQSKNIELDSMKGVREALEKQLYDLEQRHNAEIHHFQDTIRELEFELKNAKYDMSSHLREYQDLLNVKMALDAEIYSYRKLLEGEESRYSTVSDAHISVPYIYRQSPIYTLPCVKRQGGGRKAEPQYKFVEEIITETTREDVELSDTASDNSGENEGNKPDETNAEKDTEGDISQGAKEEEPQPALENGDEERSHLETEENEVKAGENDVKPTEESDNEEDKLVENTMSVSEVQQDMDADSEPTQDKTPTKHVTGDKGKDEKIDTKTVQNEEDLKDDMKGKAKIASSDISVEGSAKTTDELAKETENYVPKLDLREKEKMPEKSITEPEDKTSQQSHDPETTAQVNHQPDEKTIDVTSQEKGDDAKKDATVKSKESSKLADKEKETQVKKKEAPVESVEVNTPTLDIQPAPENIENEQKTPAVENMKEKSKNLSSPKNETLSIIDAEANTSEHMEKDQVDTSKITETEKHQETPLKTEENEEFTKKGDSKAEGLMCGVKTEEENSKSNAPEKPQTEVSEVAGEKAKPENSKKQQDSKDGGVDDVKTSEGETRVTDKKVDETHSNEAPKAKGPTPDAKPVQKETQESKVKMLEKTEEMDSATTDGPQTDSANTKDVKSEETAPKVSNQSDSGSSEGKDANSITAIKSEPKPLEKTEQVKESSKEDSMNNKDLGKS